MNFILVPSSHEILKELLFRYNQDINFHKMLNPNYLEFTMGGEDTWKNEIHLAYDGGTLIGHYRFIFYRDFRCASFSYAVLEQFQNRGYGKQIIEAALNRIFNDLGFNKLDCFVYEYNEYSLKLINKYFKHEGISREDIMWKGEFYDVHNFSLLKREYDLA